MSLWPVNGRGGDVVCHHRLTQLTTESVSHTPSWVRLGSRGWSGNVWRNLSFSFEGCHVAVGYVPDVLEKAVV